MNDQIRSVNTKFFVMAFAFVVWIFAMLMSALILTKPVHAAPPSQGKVDLCPLLPRGATKYIPGGLFGPGCIGEYSGGAEISIYLQPSPALVQTPIASVLQSGATFVNDMGDNGAEKTSGSQYSITVGRGCYYFGATVDGNVKGANPQAVRQSLKQIDDALRSMPPCGGGSTLPTVAPPPPPAAAGSFTTSGGCGYSPPNGSLLGSLQCAATSSGKPPDAEIEYHWYLDGVEQGERGSAIVRGDDELTPGAHTVTVIAVDTKNNLRATGADFKFNAVGSKSEAAPSFTVSVGCPSYTKAVQCTATVSGAPSDADLQYVWFVDGKKIDTTENPTFSDTSASDGPHGVSVTATDRNTGKTASGGSTIFVGNPVDIASNVASLLTGKPDPGPVDVAKAAGAGGAVTLALGLGQMINNVLGGGDGDGDSGTSSAGSTKPNTLPGQSDPSSRTKSQSLPSDAEIGAAVDELPESFFTPGQTAKPTTLPGESPGSKSDAVTDSKPPPPPEETPPVMKADTTRPLSVTPGKHTFDGGTPDQHTTISEGVTQGVQQIDSAIERLKGALIRPDPMVEEHFGIKGDSSEDKTKILNVIDRYEAIKSQIAKGVPFSVEQSKPMMGDADAYVYRGTAATGIGNVHVVYPVWSQYDPDHRAGTLVHELAHYTFNAVDTEFQNLTPETKSNTAESYSKFAQYANKHHSP